MLKSLTAPLLSFLLLGAANAETIDVPAEKSGEILNTPLNGKNSVRCSFTIDKTYQSDTWGSSTAVHLLNEANEQVASLTAIFARDNSVVFQLTIREQRQDKIGETFLVLKRQSPEVLLQLVVDGKAVFVRAGDGDGQSGKYFFIVPDFTPDKALATVSGLKAKHSCEVSEI